MKNSQYSTFSRIKNYLQNNYIYICIIAAFVIALGFCVYVVLYPQVGDNRYFFLSQSLDLRESNVTSTQELRKMAALKEVDLRGNEIPEEEIVALLESKPDCEVRFDVSMAGSMFDSAANEIDISGMGQEDIDKLSFFTDLRSINASGHEMSVVNELAEKYPDCKLIWDIEICGQRYPYNTTQITIGEAGREEISKLFYLTELQSVDALGCSEYEALFELRRAMPNCQFIWDVDIAGKRYAYDTEEIKIGKVSAEEIQKLIYLPNLKSVNARGCTEYDELLKTSQAMPECEFVWTVTIGGVKYDSNCEVLDFKRREIDNVKGLDKDFEKLKYFPKLKTVDMCGCGVKNTQMAAWRDQYPEYKFVWEITFGKWPRCWTVRTDVKVFSTLLPRANEEGTTSTFDDLFTYCTDLVALDLGHNVIRDISKITNLKKLQCVILICNPIADMSPLGELPELVCAELNSTQVKDLSPFAKCKKLKHLDVYYTKITDESLEALYGCDWIETIALPSNDLSEEAMDKLQENLPNCTVIKTFKNGGTAARNNPVRSEFRLAFKNWKSVVDIVDYQNITYKKGVELVIPNEYRGDTPEKHKQGQ